MKTDIAVLGIVIIAAVVVLHFLITNYTYIVMVLKSFGLY